MSDAFPRRSPLAAFGDRVDIAHTLVFGLFPNRCGAWAAALSEVYLGGGCVVICPVHRTPLVDACPKCKRQASPMFSWTSGGPVLVCASCVAVLCEVAEPQTAASMAGAAAETTIDAFSTIASGVVWSQMMVLRALRGEPVAGPRRYRLAAADFIAFIEDLIAALLYPLGRPREPGWRPGYKTAVSPTPGEMPVRDAFAVMAAIAATLALPRKVLRAPIAHPA